MEFEKDRGRNQLQLCVTSHLSAAWIYHQKLLPGNFLQISWSKILEQEGILALRLNYNWVKILKAYQCLYTEHTYRMHYMGDFPVMRICQSNRPSDYGHVIFHWNCFPPKTQ